jgi:hypothetical protein
MATLVHRSRTGTGCLWQGGANDVLQHGGRYAVIVLCADEFQPDREGFLGPEDSTLVLYAPNDDSIKALTKAQAEIACRAAKRVSQEYRHGRKILVSCMQGRNRSGLVSALALHLVYGISGNDAKNIVRSKIPNALTNGSFNRFLGALRPLKPPPRMTGYRGGSDGRDD